MRKAKILGIMTELVDKSRLKVRFSEVDSMRIVWHGEYIKYFEDGRESFGNHYTGIGYLDIYNSGYTAPVVDLHINYKLPLVYGDTAVVETKYIYSSAAKIMFEYRIYRESDGVVVAEGTSIQVFLDGQGELVLINPPFYLKWQQKWNLL